MITARITASATGLDTPRAAHRESSNFGVRHSALS